MTTHFQRRQTPFSPQQQKVLRVSDVLIERICQAYSREDAKKEVVYYWLEPLSGPDPAETTRITSMLSRQDEIV